MLPTWSYTKWWASIIMLEDCSFMKGIFHWVTGKGLPSKGVMILKISWMSAYHKWLYCALFGYDTSLQAAYGTDMSKGVRKEWWCKEGITRALTSTRAWWPCIEQLYNDAVCSTLSTGDMWRRKYLRVWERSGGRGYYSPEPWRAHIHGDLG